MSVTTLPAGSLAESVKQEIKTSAGCTQDTLDKLRQLLDSKCGSKRCVRDPARSRGKPKPTKTSSYQTYSETKCGSTQFVVLDDDSTRKSTLSGPAQLQFATQVFNTALKTLSDTAKSWLQGNTLEGIPIPHDSTSKRTLQVTSPNCKGRKDPASNVKKPQPAHSSRHQSTLDVVVQCAQLALKLLRWFQRSKRDKTASAHSQLAQAGSALTARLISLEMADAAWQELRNSKQVLVEMIADQHPVREQQQIGKPSDSRQNDDMSLLKFPVIPRSCIALKTVINFQSQVLRVVALQPSLEVLKGLVSAMNPWLENTPSRIILDSLDQGLLTTDLASQQLLILSQALLSICRRITSSGSSRNPTEARVTFELQSIVLQTRCSWWRITSHRCDLQKEFWSPLLRYLSAFYQSSSQGKKDNFMACINAVRKLEKYLRTCCIGMEYLDMPMSISKLIARMAEEIGSVDETILIYETMLSHQDVESGLGSASCLCKIAKLRLENKDSGTFDSTMDSLSAARAALTGSLKGTATELDELYHNVLGLERAIFKVGTRLDFQSTAEGPESFSRNRTFTSYTRAKYDILFFLLRYVGERPSGSDEGDVSSRYSARLDNVRKSARSILDHFLIICRHSVDLNDPPWEESELAIGNTLALYEKLYTSEPYQETIQLFFVRLSNIYWTRYTKLKTEEAPTRALLKTLRTSTELLMARPPSERQAGKLTEKLDRLATTLAASDRVSDALDTYNTAIRTFVESEDFGNMVKEADQLSFQDLWSAERSRNLLRLFSGFAQLMMKTKTKPLAPLFSSTAFSEPARCLLLEQQVYAITSLRTCELHVPTFIWLLKDVLDCISATSYPVRRLRLLHRVLSFASKEPNLLAEDLFTAISDEIALIDPTENGLGRDAGLANFHTHLVTSVQLLSTFTRSRPSFNHCYHAIKSWEALFQSCKSWTDVKVQVEDPQAFYCQLESLSDFTDMQGHSELSIDVLRIMARYLELHPQQNQSALSSCLSQLGLQLSRAGYSKKAGHTFARAKHHREKAQSKTMITLQWNLAYSEYLIDISNLEQSSETLVSAQWLYDSDFPSELDVLNTRRPRFARDKFLSQAAYVLSRVSSEQQDARAALKSAKQCVKLTSRIWAGLEKLAGLKHPGILLEKSDSENSDSESADIAQKMKDLSLSENGTCLTHRSRFGPAFWPYVSMHYQGLIQTAILSAQAGMFHDSVYYSEQAKTIAEATGAVPRIAAVEALLSGFWARACHWKESEQLYKACHDKMSTLDPNLSLVRLQMRLAQVGLTDNLSYGSASPFGNPQSPRQILATASKILLQLSVSKRRSSMVKINLEGNTSKQHCVKKAIAETKKTATKRPMRSNRPNTQKRNSPVPSTTAEAADIDISDVFPIARCEQGLKSLNARFLIKDGKMQDAALALREQILSFADDDSRHFTSVLVANTLLARAKTALAEDAVYCVLPESSVAYPSVIGKRGRDVFLSVRPKERNLVITNPTGSLHMRRQSDDTEDAKALLLEARTRLIEVRHSIGCVMDISILSGFCLAWDEMIMLSSILGIDIESRSTALLSLSYLDRTKATLREKVAINLDRVFEDKARINDWPSDRAQDSSEEMQLDEEVAIADTIVGTLPADWDVISIRLNDSGTEFLLSKLRREQSPFFLRLPLCRSSADGANNVNADFDFRSCRSEMLSIIDEANKTSHEQCLWKGKENKKEWWAEREALDERLRVLLQNMENIWFGGFSGIFSSNPRNPDLLARFSQSFQQILDKNLPSRRKPNTVEQECPGLHPHILDLFVSVGDPAEIDLDDSVADLLYFVVDILQFYGERNAYDEIDFDMITIQTIDALRAYHEAWKSLEDGSSTRHTILILDKKLHVFPWESLPCLQGQPVSRLPSLVSLRDRILMIHSSQGHHPSTKSLQISRQSGSYILNPSSDLSGTEETFAPKLTASLPTYSAIVNRAPTEPEFTSCLTDAALCLYFGHGSGAQFIRGRTIRRLDRCAVTFLMGCSSGKLVECGEFEPYGVPWNYMHAGAPAVVGTLWDVTDKDIDRFALRTLENWGLLGGDEKSASQEVKTPRRPRGRPKGKTARQARAGKTKADTGSGKVGGVCLDEAIAKSRDACVLRYLNGAAPVIYGVPVSLSD